MDPDPVRSIFLLPLDPEQNFINRSYPDLAISSKGKLSQKVRIWFLYLIIKKENIGTGLV